jgi:hypothetical protein
MPGGDNSDRVGIERMHSRDLLAVDLEGDRVDQLREDERLRVLSGQLPRVDDLAAYIGKRREVYAVAFGGR